MIKMDTPPIGKYISQVMKIVSFRQACMTRVKKVATIGYPTIEKRITDAPEKTTNSRPESERGQRAVQDLA